MSMIISMSAQRLPFKTPPADLGKLFAPLPVGCVPYARVPVILKLLAKTAKAALVSPAGREDLKRWLPLSRIRVREKPVDYLLAKGLAEIDFPAWLYDTVRAEILAKARVAQAADPQQQLPL